MTDAQIALSLALYRRRFSMDDIARHVGVSRFHVHWAITKALQLRRLTGKQRQA
jgi:AraC-like DNA-binding protein